jgi:hypothetical protein
MNATSRARDHSNKTLGFCRERRVRCKVPLIGLHISQGLRSWWSAADVWLQARFPRATEPTTRHFSHPSIAEGWVSVSTRLGGGMASAQQLNLYDVRLYICTCVQTCIHPEVAVFLSLTPRMPADLV